VLVVDDGSTDETYSIAEALGAKVVRLPVKCGAAAAVNYGIDSTRGDYVSLLSADDMFASDYKTARQMLFMEETGVDFTFCGWNFQGPTFEEMEKREKALFWLIKSHPFAAVWLNNPIDGSSVMLRRTSIGRFGRFDPKLRNQDPDGELWLRWLKQGAKLDWVPIVGTFYRHHSGQSSKKKFAWYKAMIRNRLRYL
jgi:glycosyltransferase involved in cell wall biosynthesis